MVKKLADPVLARVFDRRGTISFRDLQSLLTRLGFSLTRTKGSHFIYKHPRATRPLIVQPKRKEAKRYQLDQLRDMIVEFDLLDD